MAEVTGQGIVITHDDSPVRVTSVNFHRLVLKHLDMGDGTLILHLSYFLIRRFPIPGQEYHYNALTIPLAKLCALVDTATGVVAAITYRYRSVDNA